jgi:hypothetical protein
LLLDIESPHGVHNFLRALLRSLSPGELEPDRSVDRSGCSETVAPGTTTGL